MYFYQFSICFLRIVHHNYLFQENQVSVDNLMLLLLRRKTNARTFCDLFRLVRILCLKFDKASDLRCCTWLYFDLMIFIDLIEKVFTKT